MSLSPASIRSAPHIPRLVLPSPNGSTLSYWLAGSVPQVIGVSLRNRRAAADWLLACHHRPSALRVAIIAAGERRPDGSLRPAVEDWWGAGAVIAWLCAAGWAGVSPEARAAEASFHAVADDVERALRECASGRELAAIGFVDDVRTAAELDGSRSVPVLRSNAFVPG